MNRPSFYINTTSSTSHSSSTHHSSYSHHSSTSTSGAAHHHFTAESPLLSPEDERDREPDSPDSSTSSSRGLGSRFRFSTHRLRSSIKAKRDVGANRVSRIFDQFKEQVASLMPSQMSILSPTHSSSPAFSSRFQSSTAATTTTSSSSGTITSKRNMASRSSSEIGSLLKRGGFMRFSRKKKDQLINDQQDEPEGDQGERDVDQEDEVKRAREQIKNYWLRWVSALVGL
jgi:hypothetical protein